MTTNSVALWGASEIAVVPATAKSAVQIVNYATQLSLKDRTQIASGFKSGSYEMTMSFVWTKAMAALKRDLAKVGMKFLGEILGKSGLEDDTNPTVAISHEEAIMLAEELGVVSKTEAMRLRHAYQLISHFLDADGNDVSEAEGMEETEATNALKACVKSILGKQKVEVSTQFAAFRSALEIQVFKASDKEIEDLLISPYFFRKITLGILVGLAKTSKGAQLENSLANLNIIVPVIWQTIRDAEKLALGTAYAEAYSSGAQTASAGLKSALLKVKGFDYVPENLRSHSFIKSAERLIEAHEGTDNFYNEPAPMRELKALGTIIPIHAFPIAATATLCVRLGNPYGVCRAAQADALAVLKSFTKERWEYFFNECMPSDSRILNKLSYGNTQKRFIDLAKELSLSSLNLEGRSKRLIAAASEGNVAKMEQAVTALRTEYYGKI